MSKSTWIMTVALAVTPAVATAQADTSVDTITVLESTQISFEGQTVDYFLLSTSETDLVFIEDSAFIKLLGFIEGVDTSTLPEPIVWMKTGNPTIGDSWSGMIPEDSILSTQEMIVGTREVTVGAGTFMVYEVGVWNHEGTYLGEKLWSHGAGLVQWNLGLCNETFILELTAYSAAPSTDFWPHDVGNQYVIENRSGYTTTDADFMTMTVDGGGGEWAALPPAVLDDSGDDTTGYDGCDIKGIYAAADNAYLYLMADFWDGPPDTAWGALASPAYTFTLHEHASDTSRGYSVSYIPAPVSNWYVDGINLDATGAEVACGNVVELRIPLVNLGYYATELPGYYLAVGTGDYDVSCYNTVRLPGYCPIAVSGDVTGDYEVKTSDIVYLVNYVLKAGAEPIPCPAAGDATGDGEVKSSDIIYLVNYVLKAGPPPADICALIPGTWSCP